MGVVVTAILTENQGCRILKKSEQITTIISDHHTGKYLHFLLDVTQITKSMFHLGIFCLVSCTKGIDV